VAKTLGGVEVVSFDFYSTLAEHRTGLGRGRSLLNYLDGAGLPYDPWQHQVLYDVFEPHAREYAPSWGSDEKRTYRIQFARRLFKRLNVPIDDPDAATHADSIWELLGPASLRLFPEVPDVLRSLRNAGFRIIVVSNWQCGLGHFCTELGIGSWLDHVLSSAEVGSAKPDPGIFGEACRRLSVRAERILHVGDTLVDDLQGAHTYGLQALLIDRGLNPAEKNDVIGGLDELLDLLDAHRRG
jgi:HAD superfamily hydrolase (TIGR01549 family)